MLDINLLSKKKGSGADINVKAPAKFISPPADVTTGISYGISITEDPTGEVLIVGAAGAKYGTTANVGALYIYDAKTLEYKGIIQPTDNPVAQGFGMTAVMSADGTFLAVGAYQFRIGSDYTGRWLLYQRTAKFTFTFIRAVNGPIPGGYTGWSAAINDTGSKIWFGAPYSKVNSIEYGSVGVFNSNGSNLFNHLGNNGAASGRFGMQIKYCKQLGVLAVGRAMPSSSQSARVELYDETNNTQLTVINPPASATYASYYFGIDFDFSPDGKYLIVDSPGYREGDVAGGLVVGAYHLYKLSRSGNLITVTKVDMLIKPGDNSTNGQGWVKWVNDNVLISGSYTNKADVGTQYAGGVFLIKRNGDKLELKNSQAPWLPIESVGTYASRYLGFRTAFSQINKRLYASATNDLNPAGQPAGRLYYWDYE